jgi:uncharacterized iron-regulated membrane protein
MTWRRALLWLHRWIGLALSPVLAVVGVTGALLLLPETSKAWETAAGLHDSLALGRPGWLLVVWCTAAALLLQATGLVLWLRRPQWRVRVRNGWATFLRDLHYSSGAVTLPITLLLVLTGLGRPALREIGLAADDAWILDLVSDLHTGHGLPEPVRWLLGIGSVSFLLQGVSGIVMWWPRPRPRRDRLSDRATG